MVEQVATNGHAATKATTGIGIALAFVLTSQLYPFMLSSAFTARTIVQEKDQVDEVKTDLNWALGLSILADVVISHYLGNNITVLALGTGFAVLLYWVYMQRGLNFNNTFT